MSKGPPTTWLVHCSVNAPVDALYVPVAARVLPGYEPSGLGEPWLKYWLFHVTENERRSAASVLPVAVMRGGGTDACVCGSTALVPVANAVP